MTGTRLAFVFGGGGTQWTGMGTDLLATEPVFADTLAECDRVLHRLGGWSLLSVLADADRLHSTEISLPATCAVQIALAETVRSWGVRPDAIAGHSLGEVAAAHAAGVLDLDDALRVVFHQGRVLRAATGSGTSVSVGLSPAAAEELVARHRGLLWTVVVNSPRSVVLAGDTDTLTGVTARLRERGVFCRPLGIEYAMHSPWLAEQRRALVESLGVVPTAPQHTPVVSGVAGRQHRGDLFDTPYWGRLLCEPVRFDVVVDELVRLDVGTFVEIGPHPALHVPLAHCLEAAGRTGRVLGCLRRDSPGPAGLRELRRALTGNPEPEPGSELGPELGPVADLPRRLAAGYPAERLRILQDHVAARVAALTGDRTRPPGIDTGLFELGVDSATAVRLAEQLRADLGGQTAVSAALVFDHPTVGQIAAALADRLAPTAPPDRLAGRPRPADRDTAIAVVGLGCRFPGGADDPESFWRLLRDGVDATRPVPPGRWAETLHNPDPAVTGTIYPSRGGYLDPVDQFDAAFFGISPREAERMDPQQRILLEVVWSALEHANHAPDRLRDTRTGVFVGITDNDYALLQAGDLAGIDGFTGTGTLFSVAAGRVSHLLGLRGPCLALDTACSSSLVSVHLASQSLRDGECDLALAAGVHVMAAPELSVFLSRTGALSPDGRCRTFDATADGFARGEGCGVVVLKRLPDALAAGDDVLAVLRGSATNHDGRSSGLTVPNGAAQRELLRTALAVAGVEPTEVDYLEAHGTGTPLGDPIELGAIGSVFADRAVPLRVGSVKTNVGHLEAAAGIAGLMKVVLALRHQEIPAHLHFRDPTPRVDWATLPVEVPVAPVPWPAGDRPRIAGVSAFGIGGTNAHVVVAEPPAEPVPAARPDRAVHAITVSAAGPEPLRDLARRYAGWIADHPDTDLADVAAAANTGRARLRHRLGVLATDPARAATALADWADGRDGTGVFTGEVLDGPAPRIAFVFTGQGARYPDPRRLYRDQPDFRSAVDECAERARVPLARLLLGELAPGRHEQLVLFTVEYALAALWRAWGVRPSIVLGHSVGEYAAATVAGVLPLDTALTLVRRRGELMASVPLAGRMVSVGASPDQVTAVLRGHPAVSVAALNGPAETVLSGPTDAVSAVVDRLAGDGFPVRDLRVGQAFHSALVDPVLDELAALADDQVYGAATIPLVSTVTGEVADPAALAGGGYWRRNAREPVRFADAVGAMVARGFDLAVEVGPDPVLGGIVRRAGLDPDPHRWWLPSLRAGEEAWTTLLTSALRLHVRGVDLDWRAVDGPPGPRRPALPGYPFQRRRYWRVARRRPTGGDPLLGERLRSPALRDHVVYQRWVDGPLPAGTALAMLLSAPDRAGEFTDLTVHDVPLTGATLVQTVLSPDGTGRVVSQHGEDWRPQLTGRWTARPAPATRSLAGPAEPGAVLEQVPDLASCLDPALRLTGLAAVASIGSLSHVPRPAGPYWCHVVRTAPNTVDLVLATHAGEVAVTAREVVLRAGIGDLVRQVVWREQDAGTAALPAECVVVTDRGGVGPELATLLADRGGGCRLVGPADPLRTSTSDAVVVLLETDPAGAGGPDEAAVARLLRRCQELADHPRPPRVQVVTRGARHTGDESTVDTARAPLWGLGRVVRTELPELRCSLVDLPPGPVDPAGDAAAVLTALRTDAATELAARNGTWLAPRLAPVTPTTATPRCGAGPYLITGGLGALGLRVARRLVQWGARDLVLLGRGPGSATAGEAVRALRDQGVRVDCRQADVSVLADLVAAVDRPPRGVVHAAGVLDDGALPNQTPERIHAVLAGKAVGAWNLHLVTRDHPLDFFVLFSSLAAVVGSRGQGNYAAANAFLDALAQHRRATGLPAVSIGWGAWQDTGMAEGLDARRLAETGYDPIGDEEALAVLGAVLTGSPPHVVAARPASAPADDRPRDGVYPRPADLGAAVAPQGEVQRVLTDIWEETLRMRPVGVTDNFFRLGGDSILALGVVRRARQAGLVLAEPQVFENPTIAQLAAVVGRAPDRTTTTEPPDGSAEASLSAKGLRRLLARIEGAER